MKHLSYDAMILALDAETLALDAETSELGTAMQAITQSYRQYRQLRCWCNSADV